MKAAESKEYELLNYERGLSFFGPNIGNLFARLARVMEAAGHVEKKGHNTFHNYKYVMEADLTDAIRPLLAKEGIAIVFGAQGVEHAAYTTAKGKPGFLTTATCQVVIGDSEGNGIITTMIGTGQDEGDKGLYKALTGAMKYWLYKTFLVSTGDDPESDDQRNGNSRERSERRTESRSNIAGGDNRVGPGPRCPNCSGSMEFIAAGTRTDGRPYNAFWACCDKSCTNPETGKRSTVSDVQWQKVKPQVPRPVTPEDPITADDIPF